LKIPDYLKELIPIYIIMGIIAIFVAFGLPVILNK